MERDEVMLTVRVTAAERTLLRRLAQEHGGDLSTVVTDGLMDGLPALLCTADARPLTAALARPAPCALTVWLPTELADLLGPAADRIAELTGVRPGSCSGMLGAAVRVWLRQEPQRLAAGLRTLRQGRRTGIRMAA
ncbi:hypothetical protein [Kitasatospora camelliae]|uniref:Uncharacterized protein n=1 Tax=Kitasatospora camelliae TaxID=3156397 RepID=A0AAU8JNJ4_9ACTN